ncbi:hypothetical protein [Prochlorothrix hollandica]|uniref:Uncharacterized protein n=1 Tax=Prochlorothrix hollandica PCC 9006 = CALU 1027 TaxID=317619 RepID=A0A0M2PUJ3_PROHO|nr:hypothetical protein [Prochlorothrix hollandica]KKI99789.1 hypothetical protein PROH_07975 [Prochlorothrix hollandica PCC 9006 = CALU 1027]
MAPTPSPASILAFLVKVFGLSLGLSLLIKYGGPLLPLPATSGVALAMVLALPLTMTAVLSWQRWRQRP